MKIRALNNWTKDKCKNMEKKKVGEKQLGE
jgi:hypothetical protein